MQVVLFAVDKRYERRGIGRCMMAAVHHFAREKGAEFLVVLSNSPPSTCQACDHKIARHLHARRMIDGQ